MKWPITLFLFSVLLACGGPQINTKVEGARLMQISRDWSTTASEDSIEKTLSYWADDAIVMAPGQPSLNGKQAIREMIMSMAKIPGFKISWEPLTVSLSKSGDIAYMIEQNVITVNDSLGKPVTEINKAVTIWRKEADGSWKNIIDIWNSAPFQKK